MIGVRWNHWFFWALLCLFVLVFGLSFGQGVDKASAPRLVGNISPGFTPLYQGTSAADSTGRGLWRPWLVQVTAVTDMSFSIWAYGFGDGTSWGPISPEFAVGGADTVLTISAGTSETYTFISRTKPSGLYTHSGTGTLKAE